MIINIFTGEKSSVGRISVHLDLTHEHVEGACYIVQQNSTRICSQTAADLNSSLFLFLTFMQLKTSLLMTSVQEVWQCFSCKKIINS